jgi:succinoglycan biosynthesis protein ExoA
VTSVLDATGSGSFARAAAWIVGTPLGSGFSAHRGGLRSGFVDHGHHAAFRLDWFRSVGGYDDRFAVNEDAELDHRLRAAGGRIWLEAPLRVQYRMRETIGALARQYYGYGLWRARNLLLHRSRPRLRQVLPVGILLGLAGGLGGAVLVPGLLLLPASYLLVIGVAGASCAVATKTATGVWAAPALAVIHNAWALGFTVAALQWLYLRSARIPAERAASNRTVATPGE